jgi:hypothetical protein
MPHPPRVKAAADLTAQFPLEERIRMRACAAADASESSRDGTAPVTRAISANIGSYPFGTPAQKTACSLRVPTTHPEPRRRTSVGVEFTATCRRKRLRPNRAAISARQSAPLRHIKGPDSLVDDVLYAVQEGIRCVMLPQHHETGLNNYGQSQSGQPAEEVGNRLHPNSLFRDVNGFFKPFFTCPFFDGLL